MISSFFHCKQVLTESRGELRPDPRFDAINAVSLAIEDDADNTVDVHVFIRGNNVKSHRRSEAIWNLVFFILGSSEYQTKVPLDFRWKSTEASKFISDSSFFLSSIFFLKLTCQLSLGYQNPVSRLWLESGARSWRLLGRQLIEATSQPCQTIDSLRIWTSEIDRRAYWLTRMVTMATDVCCLV